MKKRDKLKKIIKANKKLEESYLKNKGLIKEETTTNNQVVKYDTIRHIANQGIDALNQTDRLQTGQECPKCEINRSEGHSYCIECSKCLLSKRQTLTKMSIAKNDRDRFKLKKCMEKHGLNFE